MVRDLEMSAPTVNRYMNDIRALVAFGLVEYDLKAKENPFRRLSVHTAAIASEERSPISDKILKAIRSRIAANANKELWCIWRMLEGTGCRLGEVTGLLVSDVQLDHEIPYLNLVHHPHRRLKTAGSVRRVPLIGEVLTAATEAHEASKGETCLFPRYGRIRGSDAASQILNRHVRVITDDRKIVVHSLRHTMEDKLTRAGVSEFDRNLVLGHSSGGMSERYGGADARLEVAARALIAANELAARPKRHT
jgi:integrase